MQLLVGTRFLYIYIYIYIYIFSPLNAAIMALNGIMRKSPYFGLTKFYDLFIKA
jgi:hypothetical protein